jgi:LysM repeat protein
MENTNKLQENKSNDEKTVVFGTSAKNDDSNTDKTTINNNADKTEFQNTAPSSDKPNTVEKEFSKDSKNISKPDTQKSSTGAFVATAGVAGAAAGVAAGAIFSEDIKNAFSTETFNAPESPEDEIQDVTSSVETDHVASNVETVNPKSTIETDHAAISAAGNSHASSFEASSTDAQGNSYTVSLVDENSDGYIDIASGEAHMVDGSSVSFTATGDSLDSILNNDASIADLNDFGSNPDFVNLPPKIDDISFVNDTISYEIQSGDTLSDIAAAHNTSIEHLMELNPDITDANTIFTGNELTIPTTDHISNPYEGFDFPQNNQSSFIVLEDAVSTENSPGPTEEGNFGTVDWASFNDEPVSMDDYSNDLAQSDFDSYETPSNYLESGNDFVTSEFI